MKNLLLGLLFSGASTIALGAIGDNVVKRPCDGHAGPPLYFEGSGACTGNLMTKIALPTAGIVLTHNSFDSTGGNICVSPGWKLSTDSNIGLLGSVLVWNGGDGSGNLFLDSSFFPSEPQGGQTLYPYDSLMTRDVVISSSPYVFRSPDGSTLKYGTSVGETKYISEASDRFGVKTTFTRNAVGCPTDITSYYGKHVTFAYTSGRLTSVTDPYGQSYTLTYAQDNSLKRVDLPDGTFWLITSTNNLIRALKAPDGQPSTQYQYFPGTSVLTAILNSYNWVTSISYSPTAVTVKNNGGTTTEIFKNKHLTQVIDSSGTTAYERDTNDRIKTLTDKLGRVTTMTYGGATGTRKFPFPTHVLTPDGVGTAYTYDDNLNVTQTVAQKGNKTVTSNFTWDEFSMLTSKQVNDKTETYTRVNGNLTAIINSNNQTVYSATYGNDGLIKSSTDQFNRTKNFTWEGGRLKETKDHLQRVTKYAYDNTARTVTVTNSTGFTNAALGFKSVTTMDQLGRAKISESTFSSSTTEKHGVKTVAARTLDGNGGPSEILTTTFYDNNPIVKDKLTFVRTDGYTTRSDHSVATSDSGQSYVTIEGLTNSKYGTVTNAVPFPVVVTQ